ncbi:VanZ family protein [Glaciecola sp. MF2-115]|uniref:VanZ family protein n=1 Tax=Glaciecola sp. MF2-115 TaxID=3384827 RepID=UPI0039A3784E
MQEKWLSYAIGLIVIFTLYNLMPLDLSISPAEIYSKWATGKINFIPFYPDTANISAYFFAVITDIAIWALISFCMLKSNKYKHASILSRCLFVAVCVEFLQLFVMSRFTDITDIFAAFIGVFLTIQLYTKLETSLGPNTSNKPKHGPITLFSIESCLIVWCVMLLFFAVYPSDLIQTKLELSIKWQEFFSIPLATYWQETSYGAITQLLRKVILTLPLGVLLLAVSNKHQFSQRQFFFLIIMGIGYIVSLELIQLVLASKVATLTDVVLNLFGFFIGFKLYRKHQNRASNNDKKSYFEWIKQRHHVKLSVALLLVYLLLIFVEGFEKTPYNVKELFNQYHYSISAALITVVIFFTVGFPAKCLAYLNSKKKLNLLSLTSAPFLHGVILYNLLYITFPSESLHDILGYPVWKSTPHYIELAYRFLGFFTPVSAVFFITASRLLPTNSISIRSARWAFNLVFVIIILPLFFYIVVIQASTDNITELLHNNGYSICLVGFVGYLFLLIGLSFQWLPQHKPTNKVIMSLLALITIASGSLGYVLIQLGLQEAIFKYGIVFSALQFLLSPSREELLSEKEVMFIFISLHFALLFAIYCINWSLSSKPQRLLSTQSIK